MNIDDLQRENIRNLKPYACARSEFDGEASIYLDANENPIAQPYNRYPDPLQWDVKKKIAGLKNIRPTQIMLGVGSDEAIDLVFRIFCEPRIDNVVAIDPSYGMYEVCADINNVSYRKVKLAPDFSLDPKAIIKETDEHTKVVFLCSPNNPTANILDKTSIKYILDNFKGIVVIDEAYIDFATTESWLKELDNYPHLIVLQTFSKAWGLAAIRCGMAFASEKIIGFFNKVKYPYNLNQLTQDYLLKELDRSAQVKKWITEILTQRTSLKKALSAFPFVEKIYPSDANFILVKVIDPNRIYNYLVEKGTIVRNRNKVTLCEGCLRITIGTEKENKVLIQQLTDYTL